jgi:hypothetical protein
MFAVDATNVLGPGIWVLVGLLILSVVGILALHAQPPRRSR